MSKQSKAEFLVRQALEIVKDDPLLLGLSVAPPAEVAEHDGGVLVRMNNGYEFIVTVAERQQSKERE